MDLTAQRGTTSQQYSLLLFYLMLLVARRGRLMHFFSASSFARLTQTGVTAQKTESWHNLEKRQSNEKACYFCPSGSPRHDRLCGIRPSKSAAICYKNSRCVIFLVVLKKTCSLCYCVGQSMFLLTSHQMKTASLTTAGKRDCHFSIPTHSGQ